MPQHPLPGAADVRPGQMKSFAVGEAEVLVCNVDGERYALHAKCTHYGAPLAKGALDGHRIICPWHHACFDARTGRHLEAPGCNALVRYPLTERDGAYHVELPERLGNGQTLNPMSKGGRRVSGEAPYVIVGGGAAGQRCAEGLREAGYGGPIVLLSADPQLPYDRTALSKAFLAGDKQAGHLPLRDADFYRAHDIEVRLGTRVERVDHEAHTLHLAGGETLDYGKLCMATGGSPKRPPIDGAEARGVHVLRSLDDATALRATMANAQQAVVIGAGFIGMEAAQVLKKAGVDVTAVTPEETPFGKTLGPRVGGAIQAWHEENGVSFRLGREAASIETDQDGAVTAVTLDDGTELPAQLVVLGIGVRPNTELLAALASEDGGFDLDAHGYLGHDIWCAGDVARVAQPPLGEPVRIEHWRVAQQQGLNAGYNMAGQVRKVTSVPYFWTAHWGKQLRYAGHHGPEASIRYEGDVEGGDFLAYYTEEGRTVAILGVGRDQRVAELQSTLRA